MTNNSQRSAPLAERMRPQTLSEFIGQKHILNAGSLLMRAIRADRLGSCIFYGPPGTGKTTLAGIIAAATAGRFVKLNAVSSGVADAKKVIDEAHELLRTTGKRTLLLLDECHRWSKAQSDCVLSAIETGDIVFIGSTTENPYVSMTRAIVSRCRVFELKPLSDEDIIEGLKRALTSEHGLADFTVEVTDDALAHIAWAANGDLRNAYNALELAVITTPPRADGSIYIDGSIAAQSTQRKTLSVDESMYYDMLSAFCKSLRGCDPNAALYWAFRLIESGLDPMLIFRRLLVHASEDVGLADPSALTTVAAALSAFEHVGAPEGYIPLAQAIIAVCAAPKSNSVVNALHAVQSAVREHADDAVPEYLKDKSYDHSPGGAQQYIYPHDTDGYVTQRYLPETLKDSVFYIPGESVNEQNIKRFLDKIAENKRK